MTTTDGQLAEDLGNVLGTVGVDALHRDYVAHGAKIRDPVTDGEIKLGGLLVVMDREGWLTLHHVDLLRREPFAVVVGFGPRVPWPDGSVAARKPPAPERRGEEDTSWHPEWYRTWTAETGGSDG